MSFLKFIKLRLRWVLPIALLPEFGWSALRYIRYSGAVLGNSREAKLAKIVALYHVIEKGLTMPQTRPGFGDFQVRRLADNLVAFRKLQGNCKESAINHATAVLKEYLEYHQKIGYGLNAELVRLISDATNADGTSATSQDEVNGDALFLGSEAPFEAFVRSRRSVRNFKRIAINPGALRAAIQLAQRSPSSCNRQTTRVHVYEDMALISQILEEQRGARGWGHLVPCLLIVTGDLRMCVHPYDMDLVKVDGGMFAMSLLLGLHHYRIAACPLNCYFPERRSRHIRKMANIPDNESLVVMIACGYPEDRIRLALSPRCSVEDILVQHG